MSFLIGLSIFSAGATFGVFLMAILSASKSKCDDAGSQVFCAEEGADR